MISGSVVRPSACDTRNDHKNIPRCNHPKCWDLYFRNRLGKSLMTRMLYKQVGRTAFEMTNGKKFTKYFEKFVATIDKEINGKS